MSKELPYSSYEREEIASFLKSHDGLMNHLRMGYLVEGLLDAFGRVNYAEIQSVCTQYNLQTSLLALPWEGKIVIENPEVIIVNPNNRQELKPFWAMTCAKQAHLDFYVSQYNVTYNYDTNLVHLSNAGMGVPKPGTETARSTNYRNN